MNDAYPQVVGIGSTVYDTLMVVDRYPTEDTKCEGIATRVQGGGPCATALVAAHKLGVSAAYMGAVGDDPFGEFMLEDFERWGLSTRYIRRVPETISFHAVVVLSRKDSTRTCVWSKGTVPPPDPGELDENVLLHAKALHLDGHMLDAAVYAARLCRAHGVKVSYDAGGTYPGVEKLMPYVDYLIPSEEFALKMTDETDPEKAAQKLYAAYHPLVLVLTQGVKGGIVLDEGGMRRYDSYHVEVKDSNGCGDTFHGAFVAGKIHGMDNDMACRYASAAAAVKCTRLGARYGMASHEECRAFLRERGAEIPALND